MFIPNTYVKMFARSDTQDRFSNYTYAPAVTLACSIVSLDLKVAKTSVRADSSASRGRAEEEVGTARILFRAGTDIREGDIVELDGYFIEVTRLFPQRNVLGQLDHLQVDFRKGRDPNV